MKIPFAHSTKPQETLELKAVIASLLDQARDKVSFVDRDDPDDIFTLDIRMLHEAVRRLQKTQAEPVIISTTRDREYIDYICPPLPRHHHPALQGPEGRAVPAQVP